jgi:hypothetical protein
MPQSGLENRRAGARSYRKQVRKLTCLVIVSSGDYRDERNGTISGALAEMVHVQRIQRSRIAVIRF